MKVFASTFGEITSSLSERSLGLSGVGVTTFGDRLLISEFIIGGFGFGLPLAKVYAKYFKGDIIVNPKLNCGTDVFIYLDKKIDFNDRII